MQSMIRRALLALVAVLALGVLASASASAATCKGTVEKGAVALCSGGTEQLGEFSFTTKRATEVVAFDLETEDYGEVSCGAHTGTGVLNATKGKLEIKNLVIKATGCSTAFLGCDVEPITINGSGTGLSGTVSTTGEVVLGGEGKPFATMTYSHCSYDRKFPITGTIRCLLPGSTNEAVTHRIECLPAKSGLEIFGEVWARLRLVEEATLTSNANWSLYSS